MGSDLYLESGDRAKDERNRYATLLIRIREIMKTIDVTDSESIKAFFEKYINKINDALAL